MIFCIFRFSLLYAIQPNVPYGSSITQSASFTCPPQFDESSKEFGENDLPFKEPEGLQIERVISGSPAEKAGLLAGDQLLTVEGRGITKVKDIHDAVVQKGWTKDITLTILREGTKKEIMVTLPTIDE
jgi:S1-C subfamily serine protease